MTNPGSTYNDTINHYLIFDEKYIEKYNNPDVSQRTLNLSNSQNYSIRYDKANVSRSYKWDNHSNNIIDVTNDGKNDLVYENGDFDSINGIHSGEWYVIFNESIQTHSSQAQPIDLTNETNFDIRYIGANAGDGFGYSTPIFSDINNDGLVDAIAPSWEADPNSRDKAGSVYVIHYFPHQIEPDVTNINLGQEFDFTGTVDAPDNVTTISKVQFGHRPDFGQTENSDNFHTFWWDCSAVDGNFDSNNEQYTCHHAPLNDDLTSPFHSPHVVYMRAQDEIRNPVSHYIPVLFSAQLMFPNTLKYP